MMLITAQPNAPRGYANATFVGRATIDEKPVSRPCKLASVSWPIPDSWGEIPSPRLLADVPVSVSGQEQAPLRITAKTPVLEAKVGEKLTVPLVHNRTSDFSGDTIQMKAIGTSFEKAPGFDLPVKADASQVVFDLKALNVPPGEYRVSFLGGGVVKYRYRPELVTTVELASQKKLIEVKSLEAEVKKVASDAQNAPPAKKEQMTKTLAAVSAKMKAATEALNATQPHGSSIKPRKRLGQPRDYRRYCGL